MKRHVKQPTTYQEQIELFKQRNLLVTNESKALETLSRISYYTISGYLHDFKMDSQDSYINGLSFEKICKIIEFDKKFRSIIASSIETIERTLKTKISYACAHAQGALGYLNPCNFRDAQEHGVCLQKLTSNILCNKNVPFVKHHLKNYGGDFPIWVAIELFTMGMIAHFYKNLPARLQKDLAKEFFTGVNQLASWIEIIACVRNMSAHYMRLYNAKMQKTPTRCSINFDSDFSPSYKIFDALYTMKFLILDKGEWNNETISNLSALILQYEEYICLTGIGFPNDWEKLLRKV